MGHLGLSELVPQGYKRILACYHPGSIVNVNSPDEVVYRKKEYVCISLEWCVDNPEVWKELYMDFLALNGKVVVVHDTRSIVLVDDEMQPLELARFIDVLEGHEFGKAELCLLFRRLP